MPRNKPRVHLALYARPKHPDSYHYALFLAPKDSSPSSKSSNVIDKDSPTATTKHHVKNTLLVDPTTGTASQPWRYERAPIITDGTAPPNAAEARLLVRVVVAKLRTREREPAEEILAAVPVDPSGGGGEVPDGQNGNGDGDGGDAIRGFSCQTWVREAYRRLYSEEALATSSLQWEEAQREALAYLEKKRGQGRWSTEWTGPPGVALLDLLDGGKEVVE